MRSFYAQYLMKRKHQNILFKKYIEDDVKSVLHILSAHNKNNSQGATIGILIKLKP